MERKERKETSQVEEREKLLKQLNEYGGLWEKEKDKKSALKADKLQVFLKQDLISDRITTHLSD